MGHILVPPRGECWYLLLVMGNTALLGMNQDIKYTTYELCCVPPVRNLCS